MNKITVITSTILIIISLTACSEKTQSVEWYLEHKDELAKEYKKCKLKTLEELVKDKHCHVIKKARDKAFWEHQENAPIPTFK